MDDGDGGLLSVAGTVDLGGRTKRRLVLIAITIMLHRSLAPSPPFPPNADVDATTDSFQFTFEGTTYTVNLVIEQPPYGDRHPTYTRAIRGGDGGYL